MIDSFRGEHAFLSNFFPCRIIYEGRVWKTVEHAFQAAKTDDVTEKVKIQRAGSAVVAKRLGRQVALRDDWDEQRLLVMMDLIHLKFREPVLRAKLIATFPHQLVEGNTWGDRYWGMVDGVGDNSLGKILMMERAELMRR